MAKARIVSLSGPSGAGKTSIARELLRVKRRWNIVLSVTTRDHRDSDIPGEYMYKIDERMFDRAEREGKFIWTVAAHGNKYGTLKSSINAALNDRRTSLILLAPNVLPTLLDYARERGEVIPVFVTPPEERVLRARLEERGDGSEDIERRIADCKTWEGEARASKVPFVFIDNSRSIKETVKKILKAL